MASGRRGGWLVAAVVAGTVAALAGVTVARSVAGPGAGDVYALTDSSTPASAVPVTVGSGLLPGSSVVRDVAIDNRTGHAVQSVRLWIRAVKGSELTSDRRRGVQLSVLDCGAHATKEVAAGVCTAGAGAGDAQGSAAPLTGARTIRLASALPPDGVARLALVFSLPDDSPSSMQGQSSTLDYAFTTRTLAG